MKQQVRELLVTAKAAQKWQDLFDEQVEELMLLVSKIDTDKQIMDAGEVMDVYHKTQQKPAYLPKKLNDHSDKPFEFLVFRN